MGCCKRSQGTGTLLIGLLGLRLTKILMGNSDQTSHKGSESATYAVSKPFLNGFRWPCGPMPLSCFLSCFWYLPLIPVWIKIYLHRHGSSVSVIIHCIENYITHQCVATVTVLAVSMERTLKHPYVRVRNIATTKRFIRS